MLLEELKTAIIGSKSEAIGERAASLRNDAYELLGAYLNNNGGIVVCNKTHGHCGSVVQIYNVARRADMKGECQNIEYKQSWMNVSSECAGSSLFAACDYRIIERN